MSDSFHGRIEAKISRLRSEAQEDRAQILEGYLAKVDAALPEEDIAALPEAA
jgi:hypothetical protein